MNWSFLALVFSASLVLASAATSDLGRQFDNPPPGTRPWVYWYFMDGNLTHEGITADLEAMRDAGIGGAIFLEVDLGVPRGPVKFMTPEWRQLFVHAVHEAQRLGIELALGSGPGWCGTGGPWVTPQHSMQHLVASETNVTGPMRFDSVLPRPKPREPFFGEGTLTPDLAKQWREFYRDVAVLAFPRPQGARRLADVDEKALYKRAPYSSSPGVKPFLPAPAESPAWSPDECIPHDRVMNVTAHLSPEGRLQWNVPPGDWTILRFVRTSTGQITRPAPEPGLGFETDKFDPAAIDAHFGRFIGTLLRDIGPRKPGAGGLTTLHFDSWEMSSQNWSEHFRAEFRRRRGYDSLRYLPAFTGRVVDNSKTTERFLWDLRQTAQELVIENHVTRLKTLAHQNGLSFSLEPYDMSPNADLSLGAVVDIPMSEFWWLGFNTTFSVIEAASIAHTGGLRIVAAESFTSNPGEDWRAYPANIKALGDWAFGAGVNRIVIHRYQHQPRLDHWPGMQMGPYGVHWERTQTWWPMASAYHTYLARCQLLLREGLAVADILFLAGEGAPHVFRPAPSATLGNPPDRRRYNFDGCAPDILLTKARVSRGRIVFPGGTSYRLLVLPDMGTMTPALLRKVKDLVHEGATVVGAPPRKSPSLAGFPKADTEVQKLVAGLWNNPDGTGKGRLLWGPEFTKSTVAPTVHPLLGAKWIWSDEGDASVTAPLGARYFRRNLELPVDAIIEEASVHLTADNSFTLKVNGHSVGKGDNFNQVSQFDLKNVLYPGTNLLDVTAKNSGEIPNPAGFIAVVDVRLRDGQSLRWQTDRTWLVSNESAKEGTAARELGVLGIPPWGQPAQLQDEPEVLPLYPSYDALAKVLEAEGTPADFQTDGPIRYTHRTTGDSDIYFVANRLENVTEACCVFRVAGRQPELWHPVTGQRRDLPAFETKDGRTTVPLRFEPFESYFILFRKNVSAPKTASRNFARLRLCQTIDGPWELTFDAKWGAPNRVTLTTLEDWTKRPEEGIKHYSGIATYRKTFEASRWKTEHTNSNLFLDLGVVKNIARVRLNGRDLGVVWCARWHVDVTNALKPGKNDLEITVANLWVNRLIGDAALPQDKQLTRTTKNPFKADSHLLESGLLGPVTLQAVEN